MTDDRTLHLCTIIAKNYISFARTLCASFLEHHPDGSCHVLIIDDITGFVDPGREQFSILSMNDLVLPDRDGFRARYDVTELSTALKPYLLSHLLATTGTDRVLYLDPDILVLAPLDGLYHDLDEHDIVLTPHLNADYPDDGKEPDDSFIMRSGTFNLGFIGVRRSPNTDRFLSWWQHKLIDKCIIDHSAGYFVDQKFIDYALPLFDNIYFERDPGYNVAYWNLHSRLIRFNDGVWSCNGGRLFFYHFSNYKPERPRSLSGHQDRYRMEDFPDLSRLFDSYRNLLKQNGYDDSRWWPYTQRSLSPAAAWKARVRRTIRFCMRIKIGDLFDKRNYSLLARHSARLIAGPVRSIIRKVSGPRDPAL